MEFAAAWSLTRREWLGGAAAMGAAAALPAAAQPFPEWSNVRRLIQG